MNCCLCNLLLPVGIGAAPVPAEEFSQFAKQYCVDCHSGEMPAAGLNLTLARNPNDPADFAIIHRAEKQIRSGQMPPSEADQPTPQERQSVLEQLHKQLTDAHRRVRGTVLRRLNRFEYENTLNDLFGTELQLAATLPEDGRQQEFDNVGATLGISMVHLERYLEAISRVIDAAVAPTTEPPVPGVIEAGYRETREAEQFLGKKWKLLPDDSVVRFSGHGYPSGMIRGTSVRVPGRYRVRVSGYGWQTDQPITFSVEGTSFARGSDKPIYGYWAFEPGSPDDPTTLQTIKFETWIEKNYMVAIEPYGIQDPARYQRESIDDYPGPGLAIRQVTLQGPLHDQWPSAGHQLIFDTLARVEIPPANPRDRERSWYQPKFELQLQDERAEIDRVLQRVATAAFRRPVQSDELTEYRRLYLSQRAESASPETALRVAVTAIFCSPRFLYLQEPPGLLDDWALASRLSFFLTRSTPDQHLLQAAAAGQLSTPEGLREQTNRLLDGTGMTRFLADLSNNWLDLRELDFTAPDQRLFPEYDAYLRYSMPLETTAFLGHLINRNLPVSHLVRSDFAMLNDRLAAHYDLPPVVGSELRPVRLPENSLRGGLLTQASILKVTANGTNTSPVIRGAWVLERILNQSSPPPPPGTPGVEPDIRGATTLREQLRLHRDMESCQNCHKDIDPPGFALESFNPIGGFRTYYRSQGTGPKPDVVVNGRPVNYRIGPDVDASGTTADGVHFDDFKQFRDQLAANQRMLAQAFAAKLLTVACGRQPGYSDQTQLEQIINDSERSGFGTRDLIHLIVQSEIFRTK
jgi:hypothetical protein